MNSWPDSAMTPFRGGIEFMRPWTEEVYGIPPEQVVGSSIVNMFEMRDGKPVLLREAKLNFIDDKEGKPVGINQHIGVVRFLPLGILMVICKCCNILPLAAPGNVLQELFTTLMGNVNLPMIVILTWGVWIKL